MSREVRKVPLPAKFGAHFVRALNTVEDIARLDDLKAAGDDKPLLMATQLAYYECNESGQPVFATPAAALEHIREVSTPSALVSRILKVGSQLNDLDDDSLEQTEKN